MRFDDMLATVLAQPRDSEVAGVAGWRQLVDILAQRGDAPATSLSAAAFELLRQDRARVPVDARIQAARALAGRPVSPELVAFFAEDRSDVAAPALTRALVPPGEWIALLPRLSPNARALLRHRRDLDPAVSVALASFGATDLILETTSAASAKAEELKAEELVAAAGEDEGEQQIARLVARIEAFRRARADVPPPAEAPRADSFRFESSADGVVRWVEGAPRGALIGQSIAISADALGHGVDGHAAGAFRRRAPFRDARLTVAGEGTASGSWRISAVPFFTEGDGRFAGYRGAGRRPRRDEEAGHAAPTVPAGLFGSSLAPDSLRQLVHELRTPINAIVGFAEMVERQLLGPVSSTYRDWARDIVEEANRLLAAVDDIDTAARVETDGLTLDPQAVDGEALLRALHDGYAALAVARGAALQVRLERDLPPLAVDPIAADRMFARLLAATIGLAGQGETIVVDFGRDPHAGDQLLLAISRPALLAEAPEQRLLDPGYSPDGEWPEAPALGLGFALRLVRNIAREAGGALDLGAANFSLRLPAKAASPLSGEQGR